MVVDARGTARVVWQRPVGSVPVLNMSRSLGDFWSYNPHTQQFAVSPVPDVTAHPLNLSIQKFVVVASDGLWNVMTPSEVVRFVDKHRGKVQTLERPNSVVSALISEALDRWKRKGHSADNISVLIAFLSQEDAATTTSALDITPSMEHKHFGWECRYVYV